ncbi:MAG: DUF222 domain-containing protein [Actinobacteria bacterium]|nr:DUF222 domain-containing protein [Actinomycetota bacterium]
MNGGADTHEQLEEMLRDIDVAVLLRHVTDRLLDHGAEGADGLDDTALHETLVLVHRERSRLGVAFAELLAEWDTRRIWESDGSRSPAHRLARETRSSVGAAREDLRRARRVRHLPLVRDAVAAGVLSLDHLDLIGHVNTPERRHLFQRDEALLVRKCSELSYADGARLVRYWAGHADEQLADERNAARPDDGAPDDDAAAPGDANAPPDDEYEAHAPTTGSRLHASRTLDEALIIDGTLDAIDGTIVENELNRLAEEIRLADRHAGIDRSPAQRRAAALVEMARRSATAPEHGRRPRPLFTVLVGERTLDRLCELSNGIVVTPAALLPHLGEAEIESVLFDGPSTVIAVSSRRTFTGAVRRAVQVRDRRCRHRSDCDVPADDCDVDHIVPAVKGGPTSQFNGRLECKVHNRIPHMHDHDTEPAPERHLDRLDELRAKIRWRCRNDPWYLETDDDA